MAIAKATPNLYNDSPKQGLCPEDACHPYEIKGLESKNPKLRAWDRKTKGLGFKIKDLRHTSKGRSSKNLDPKLRVWDRKLRVWALRKLKN